MDLLLVKAVALEDTKVDNVFAFQNVRYVCGHGPRMMCRPMSLQCSRSSSVKWLPWPSQMNTAGFSGDKSGRQDCAQPLMIVAACQIICHTSFGTAPKPAWEQLSRISRVHSATKRPGGARHRVHAVNDVLRENMKKPGRSIPQAQLPSIPLPSPPPPICKEFIVAADF
eukprot:4875510-Pleurochrysis_carterae.AAC.4